MHIAGMPQLKPPQLLPPACLSTCINVQMCRERELAAVKVRQEDVEVIMAEAEVDRKLADRRLRECNASLVDALRTFL